MTDTEQRLLKILTERSFRRGQFKLSSGGESSYYIDGRMSAVFSESAHLIGEVLYDRSRDWSIDALGGMEVGAVPLTTAAVISYHQHGRRMEGFWVRNAVKSHGTQKLIEGKLEPGAKVLIVDDVITQGQSSLKAAKAVRDFGCEVVKVLALVDRLQGAAELFRAERLDFKAVFTIRDFGVSQT